MAVIKSTNISCPVCNTPIVAEINALLLGVSFTCTNCFASIGMSQSSIPVAREAVKKFNEFKIKAVSEKQ